MKNSRDLSKIQPDHFTMPATLNDNIPRPSILIRIHDLPAHRTDCLSLQFCTVEMMVLLLINYTSRGCLSQNGEHLGLVDEIPAANGTGKYTNMADACNYERLVAYR